MIGGKKETTNRTLQKKLQVNCRSEKVCSSLGSDNESSTGYSCAVD